MPPGLPPLHGPCRRVLCNTSNGRKLQHYAKKWRHPKISQSNACQDHRNPVPKCNGPVSKARRKMWSPRQPEQAFTAGESTLDSLTICNSSISPNNLWMPDASQLPKVYRNVHLKYGALGLKSLIPTLPSPVSGVAEGSPRNNRMRMLQHRSCSECWGHNWSQIQQRGNSQKAAKLQEWLKRAQKRQSLPRPQCCQTTKKTTIPQGLQTFRLDPKSPFNLVNLKNNKKKAAEAWSGTSFAFLRRLVCTPCKA